MGPRRGRPGSAAAPPPGPGADSEFYAIERWLATRGFPRAPAEPLGAWARRVEATGGVIPAAPLGPLAGLHCSYRFDPRGLAPAERAALRTGVAAWLAAAGSSPAAARASEQVGPPGLGAAAPRRAPVPGGRQQARDAARG